MAQDCGSKKSSGHVVVHFLFVYFIFIDYNVNLLGSDILCMKDYPGRNNILVVTGLGFIDTFGASGRVITSAIEFRFSSNGFWLGDNNRNKCGKADGHG